MAIIHIDLWIWNIGRSEMNVGPSSHAEFPNWRKLHLYIYNIGVLMVNIEFMWRGLETWHRRSFWSKSWYEASMVGPLLRLLISSWSVNKHGHHKQFFFLVISKKSYLKPSIQMNQNFGWKQNRIYVARLRNVAQTIF
jgi:hypothetical protein